MGVICTPNFINIRSELQSSLSGMLVFYGMTVFFKSVNINFKAVLPVKNFSITIDKYQIMN
jgi:hypothetical protein